METEPRHESVPPLDDAKLVCASFGFTTFRHFMATQMLDAGVPLAVVSRRLDHRRFSTTLDRYAHAVPGGDAVAAQTLWRIVVQAG